MISEFASVQTQQGRGAIKCVSREETHLRKCECPFCGEVFYSAYSWAVYCSDAHRVAAFRARRRVGRLNPELRKTLEGLQTIVPKAAKLVYDLIALQGPRNVEIVIKAICEAIAAFSALSAPQRVGAGQS